MKSLYPVLVVCSVLVPAVLHQLPQIPRWSFYLLFPLAVWAFGYSAVEWYRLARSNARKAKDELIRVPVQRLLLGRSHPVAPTFWFILMSFIPTLLYAIYAVYLGVSLLG